MKPDHQGKPPIVLTIAGSDSGGGAGIQADLKTFHALGCFGTSAITAITAQNTREVRAVQAIDPLIVRDQIQAVLDDLPVAAVKTGMLFSTEIIDIVQATCAVVADLPLVVDPVMVASSGARLLEPSAEGRLMEFLRSASIITPNLPEAELILGKKIRSVNAMQDAAYEIREKTGAAVLLKGGHRLEDTRDEVVDVLYDGTEYFYYRSQRLPDRNTHGTGCTLSAGIAAGLARGLELRDAIRTARDFLIGAIQNAPGFGQGVGPLNHMWK